VLVVLGRQRKPDDGPDLSLPVAPSDIHGGGLVDSS
jgi:hypothetical protein